VGGEMGVVAISSNGIEKQVFGNVTVLYPVVIIII
jgi:hypothetical protein